MKFSFEGRVWETQLPLSEFSGSAPEKGDTREFH